jgi:DNA invertase Pin-like site-specific DNA recombinase
MARRAKTTSTAERAGYDVEAEWTPGDLDLLEELKRADAVLPADAPRALLSVRLSVLTDDTTSPVRQELDLRVMCRERGWKVAGVASDLNVSATKVPPWKRKQLGDWLNNRVPEFDVILFWKLDRFVRRLSDLGTMIRWCDRYGKNLVSKNDQIDLSTTAGQIMVTIIGGIAEIETANTSTRVSSLWDYNKTQGEWLVGKPVYGYVTQEDERGKIVLVHDPIAYRVLHWCRKRAMAGASARRLVRTLVRAGVVDANLQVSSLLRRLRNPALMGYRTESDGNNGSKLILGTNGKPIRVAAPIFTEDEFESLQKALDSRKRKKVVPTPVGDRTKFLGVLVCSDCKANATVKVTRNKWGTYPYLRCQKCKGGGIGVPNPNEVYDQIVSDALSVIGDFPVETREYARGAEARKEVKRLEESIAYYMRELEPGGRYTKSRFTREQAQTTLDEMIQQLDAIDPETTQDRWVKVHNGKTFREHWEEGGMEAMGADLARVGIKCEMTRAKVEGVTQVGLKLLIPKDVKERLVITEDHFSEDF